MKIWVVTYMDGHHETIEADQVAPFSGSIIMFVNVSNLQTPDGKQAGIPIAFVDVSNPSVRSVRLYDA